MDSVRLRAKRCHSMGWKGYDEQYRLRKNTNPESSWAQIDYELWLLYMNDRFPGSQSRYQGIGNPRSSGKCFNNKGSCFRHPCTYLHLCMKCSGDHPSIMCPMQQSGFQQHKTGFNYPRGGTPRFQSPTRFQYPLYRPRMPFQSTRGRARGQGYMGPGQNTYQN